MTSLKSFLAPICLEIDGSSMCLILSILSNPSFIRFPGKNDPKKVGLNRVCFYPLRPDNVYYVKRTVLYHVYSLPLATRLINFHRLMCLWYERKRIERFLITFRDWGIIIFFGIKMIVKTQIFNLVWDARDWKSFIFQ